MHARLYERERSRRRGSAAARGYTAEWRRIRERVLVEEPRCRLCGAPATEVHHIVPLSSGGTHDRTNLMPLCARCHRRVTTEQRGRG
ncbi:MAG: HNH endonuclease signature motif containing protein [Thermomicrobium sp.]|nr:HNH endonuclease [Thermomicrobium sp.]MDW8006266.1 HNH endonuclease signature motif containing protein [Thermomicrobium sp.]